MSELVEVQNQSISTELQEVLEKAKDYTQHAKAANTTKSYRADWQDFTSWCQARSLSVLPADPQTVALYLTDLADSRKTSTLQRRLSAISQAHQTAGYDSPTNSHLVRTVWAGIRRTKGVKEEGKDPILVEDLRQMVEMLPDTLTGKRDRALLLIGFSGGFRRSELVSINREDIQTVQRGMVVNLRRSKTDQEGRGEKVGIPRGSRPETCPLRSLEDWLTTAGITEGPIFRPINRYGQVRNRRLTDRSVALIVKKAVESIGLDPKRFAGHSLRAGIATSAAMAGKDERAIMKQTRHKSTNMVRRYIRDGELFNENAAMGLGL
ncbi:site-specific integrase [Melghirimyces algeriensis]|uniref:Site-specific recombinase XerD n=1 Tax=Melghirimyces algeriensis TaxID=910412 RepID=A0A521CFY5_9BACL|nr:site-specific integrase [Melghirimyces algeriensis]SMO58312.1 Site-specific recombinase XerD [Melghirimyces algeriensis]